MPVYSLTDRFDARRSVAYEVPAACCSLSSGLLDHGFPLECERGVYDQFGRRDGAGRRFRNQTRDGAGRHDGKQMK